MRARAGWAPAGRHAADGSRWVHAALAPAGDALALLAEDASLALWRRVVGEWREVWRERPAANQWSGAVRVTWAHTGTRLLVSGVCVLLHHWELLVLRLNDEYVYGGVSCRARTSAGAAGCWADLIGDTFLSFELQLLGPGLACTTVWLNAATQETQSEYIGVTAPLLRVYNEGGAHIT